MLDVLPVDFLCFRKFSAVLTSCHINGLFLYLPLYHPAINPGDDADSNEQAGHRKISADNHQVMSDGQAITF